MAQGAVLPERSQTLHRFAPTISDLHVSDPCEGGRILIDITNLGEVGEAVVRHRRQGGVVIINGSLYLDPPSDREVPAGARVVADDVVFVALPNSGPQVKDQGGLCLATGGLR